MDPRSQLRCVEHKREEEAQEELRKGARPNLEG